MSTHNMFMERNKTSTLGGWKSALSGFMIITLGKKGYEEIFFLLLQEKIPYSI